MPLNQIIEENYKDLTLHIYPNKCLKCNYCCIGIRKIIYRTQKLWKDIKGFFGLEFSRYEMIIIYHHNLALIFIKHKKGARWRQKMSCSMSCKISWKYQVIRYELQNFLEVSSNWLLKVSDRYKGQPVIKYTYQVEISGA